ncbi:unnamed protein product [Acanthoscelides obtectus]|uniref:Lateral signaling target protein 2 homolog n=1 Tax=Acanthoscelides obtectus TaxID=200917 RepID=A0A9P0M7H4_ACAOB|nr:unnamed protein product [Acanthoscelides obtectus]CAK1622563.1 Lateral signaling target protein 2 homolog [Acanthoscelides obtectus]
MMDSIRKWLYKPKKDDTSLLAQFFHADENLNAIAGELDSFDGRKDPERCTLLVTRLRLAQDRVLTITNSIMDVLIGDERANRDFRVKFPEDVLQDNLAGQLWFGAECLAAGSSIMNRESESTAMRPLAKAVTKSLENVRNLLRDACLRNNTPNGPIKLDSNELVTEMLMESLKIFDRLFAEFELAYVSAMVPVKSTQEYELQEMIGVLFSETLQRALKMKILTQEMVDDCDPALMFTIPRLAIVSGLLIFPNGPLSIDCSIEEMSEMFRPFRQLLHKIRELLWTLTKRELYALEKLLCDNEQIDGDDVKIGDVQGELDEFVGQFYDDCYMVSYLTVGVTQNSSAKEKRTRSPKQNLHHNHNHQQPQHILTTVELPSTSNRLIPPSVFHSSIMAANSSPQQQQHSGVMESPPDRDSLEMISAAAATLSSILSTGEVGPPERTDDLESPNDSGVCTETASLDRSPSLELTTETKHCTCTASDISTTVTAPCNCFCKKTTSTTGSRKMMHARQADFSPGVIALRKKGQTQVEEDTSSTGSSSDTSSFHSNCVDDEELALAMQAAEISSRNEIRAKYRSSEDLLHRLFVCIAGVADQLQTNFACDLRNILKSVFLMNASDGGCLPPPPTDTSPTSPPNRASPSPRPPPSLEASMEYHPAESDVIETDEFSVDPNILAQEALFDTNVYFHLEGVQEGCEDEYENLPRVGGRRDSDAGSDYSRYVSLREDIAHLHHHPHHQQVHMQHQRPPAWIPDIEAPRCMSCGANFTVVKRRHHCRNCGKVFCARCSSNSVPLPKYGHVKPVRVCNRCFLYNLTPFTV